MSDQTPSVPVSPGPVLHREYRGHRIEFQPTSLKFFVTGPEFESFSLGARTFASFDESRARIDHEVEDAQALRAKKVKLNAEVYDESGELHSVTRINRTSGLIHDLSGRSCYPNVPWIGEALQRRRALRTELNALEDSLSEVSVSVQRAYGRISADEYPGYAARLEADLTAAKDKALKLKVAEIKARAAPSAVS